MRVAKRVSEGGHNIPQDVILRRYVLGISNFFNIYKDIVDCWTLVDNSQNPRVVVADNDGIYNEKLYKKIKDYVK